MSHWDALYRAKGVTMRWLFIGLALICLLSLAPRPTVIGNTDGGWIDGLVLLWPWAIKPLAGLGLPVMSEAGALQIASTHCGQFAKTARITSIDKGRTFFQCI